MGDGECCDRCGGRIVMVWWCGDRDNGALWRKIYEQATGQRRGDATLGRSVRSVLTTQAVNLVSPCVG